MNLILKPDFVLHKGLKVFAMASRLIGRFVRKRATMENSLVAWSEISVRPGPSLSDSERDFHRFDKSSIIRLEGEREEGEGGVFPYNPKRRTQLA